MTVRERLEQEESQRLSPYACLSSKSRGREREIPKCDMRTEFQRDRDRIIHCKSFRRLKYKTQVFLAPDGDHYRTRLTHTLEVSQVARTLARALQLNEDLAEAISLGHDLGHTPFGHIGENSLNHLMAEGFHHNQQSLRVVEVLENSGDGLNLTWEVRDGILCHSGNQMPSTLEGQCVRRADRIAYLNHDLDDAIRAGVLDKTQLPQDCFSVLGFTHGERINNMVTDIVNCSMGKNEITMSPIMQSAMDDFRSFMFEKVYMDKWRKAEEKKCDYVIRGLFEHYSQHPGEMPEEYIVIGYQHGTERAVCDFISGMTDRYAIKKFQQLFVPTAIDSQE